MPKPIKFSYEKRPPYRDAFYVIVVCEGINREVDYFKFFDGLTARLKLVPVSNPQGSAPNQLTKAALAFEKELGAQAEIDRLWFVIDTDRWKDQLHVIREEAKNKHHWKIAQSNPCFEVWLYFHAKSTLPEIENLGQCNPWKQYLPTIIQGGFNSDFHPIAIETATSYAKSSFQATGYFPNPGSTQVWQLAEEIIPLIKKELDEMKATFPAPGKI